MPQLRLACSCALALCLALPGMAQAQTAPAGNATAPTPPARPDPRIERIRTEDGLARIDELRVGGETQTIVVAPKDGMPVYDVQPANNARSLPQGERGNAATSGGTRVWKLLTF